MRNCSGVIQLCRSKFKRRTCRNQQAVDELISWAATQKPPIDLLINNAGLGDLGAFATADPDRVDAMMQVNMVALDATDARIAPCHDRAKSRARF